MTIKELYKELIRVNYKVVEEETRKLIIETYDLSTAIDEAEENEKDCLVIRDIDEEYNIVWNTKFQRERYETSRK